MIHLFLDTNVYLNFYHFSDEDLGRLTDLNKLINETNDIKLHVPAQVVDEYERNREAKIYDCLKTFTSTEIRTSIPVICTGYAETAQLKALMQQFSEAKRVLIENLNRDIANESLKADTIIRSLFANQPEVEPDIVEAAMDRYDSGKPPGKDKSYGDAINWEYLLAKVPDGEDLYLVSDDKDYASPLDQSKFLQYLAKEWMSKKRSSVHFYKSLKSFFKDKYPKVEFLRDEYIKDSIIQSLELSPSFDKSRAALTKLANNYDFSKDQLNRIVRVSLANAQVYNAHRYSPELIGYRLHQIVGNRRAEIEEQLLDDFDLRFVTF